MHVICKIGIQSSMRNLNSRHHLTRRGQAQMPSRRGGQHEGVVVKSSVSYNWKCFAGPPNFPRVHNLLMGFLMISVCGPQPEFFASSCYPFVAPGACETGI